MSCVHKVGVYSAYRMLVEEVKKKVLVAQLCLTLCDPMDCSLSGSSVHRDSLGKNTGVGSLVLLLGIEPRPPALQADPLPSEPSGKPICVCVYIYICCYVTSVMSDSV